MEIIAIVLLIAALVGFVLWIKLTKRSREYSTEIKNAFSNNGIDKKYWTPNFSYTTPGGVEVKSNRELPAKALTLIDEGISNQIDAYNRECPEWTAGRNLSDYPVYVIKPMTTNMDGSPAIFVKGYQSAGTLLYGGEMWEELNKRPIVVIADQHDQNWAYESYFRNSADYESEHGREWLNKKNNPTGRFYHWAHAGDVHPHAQRQAVGLVNNPFSCGWKKD